MTTEKVYYKGETLNAHIKRIVYFDGWLIFRLGLARKIHLIRILFFLAVESVYMFKYLADLI